MYWSPWYTFITWLFFRYKCYTISTDEYDFTQAYLSRAQRFRWIKEYIGPQHEAWRLERLPRNSKYYERLHFRKAADMTLYLLTWGR